MTSLGRSRFMTSADATLEALYGDTVTIAGLVVDAAVSTVTEGGLLGLGVETVEAILKVRIRKVLHPDKPEVGKAVLIHNSKKWRVEEVTDDHTSGAWYLSCIPAES